MRTPTIELVALPPETFAALDDGDLSAARDASGLSLPEVFLEQPGLWRLRRVQIVATPLDAGWVVRAIVNEAGEVVGHSGFHAGPDPDGTVEVGYRVSPQFRGQGYAHAALDAQLRRARADAAVHTVRATISQQRGVAAHRRTRGIHPHRRAVRRRAWA